MEPKRREYIEQFTERLLRDHGLWGKLPVNVRKLSRKLGFIRVEENFGDDFSGAAIDNGVTKIISINKKHHINRKRFTHAHEICHLLWHSERGVNVDTVINYRDSSSDKGVDWREIEANRFAASLLVPRALLDQEIAELGTDSLGDEEIAALARRFKVSAQAMCIRLTSIGRL